MFKFDWTEATVGYSLSVVGISVAVVQGFLVKHSVNWWGERKTILIGYASWLLGLLLFAFVWKSWMLFVVIIPYCFGGIATPTLQGILSNQYAAQQQGELQGAITSLMSLTAIIGPVLMTSIFYFFTNEEAAVVFPGAPFILGAILVVTALFFSLQALKKVGYPKTQ